MKKLLSFALLVLLMGCSESASSGSKTTIMVVSGGNNGPTTYMVYYEDDEIEDYTRHTDGTISIYLKNGIRVQTSMFTIETE